jgi:ADP-ribose pyrophosphatase YjhB (NUDIX family)
MAEAPELKFAPREEFETVLEWAVLPTFDLVIEYGEQGVIMVRRKIEPYKDVWALPGLRMMKPEGIEDTLVRIAKAEVGLEIDPAGRTFLDQYVGKFKTEHERQDLSTGYAVRVADSQEIKINEAHFSDLKLITSAAEIPERTGAMYRHYLKRHFDR